MSRLRFDPLFWVGVGPFDGGGGFVVVTDVAQEFSPQVVQGAKDAARNDVTLDFGEPIFDLVEPGGVGRREVQVHPRVGREERLDAFRHVRRQIVDDDMDLALARLGGDDVLEELDERIAGGAAAPSGQ